MKPTDLAWAAGIIDGEGTATIFHVPNNGQVVGVLSVGNTDPRMLVRLATLFGGKVRWKRPQKQGWREQYVWDLRNHQAAAACRLLLPYLVCKREQAELVVAFAELVTKGAYRGGSRKLDPVIQAQRIALRDKVVALNQFRPSLGEEVSNG